MVERTKETPKYESPLKIVDPSKEEDFENIETFHGSIAKLLNVINHGINKIETGSQTEKDPAILFYRTYELIKVAVEEKIEVDRAKKGYTDTAIDAIRLATDLAIACDLKDEKAREIFKEFKRKIITTSLRDMLRKHLEESPDFGITPEHPADKDLELAREIAGQAKGREILVIGIGHRGIRRSLDIFLNYRAETNTPDSVFWPVRFSANCGDRHYPNISWQEAEELKRIARSKKVVIIGPKERMEGATAHLKQILLKGEKSIDIELPAKPEESKPILSPHLLKKAAVLKKL
ncbi:hypothetical protein KKG52_01885 [Patescibacteria group bacterium]|nr:hypothetical protein [Patescibacteria group bacterium]